MKYLLDSNILRHFIRGHLTLMGNITRFRPENVALPFIVEAEQMRGRYDAVLKAEPQNLMREQQRLRETRLTISIFDILYLDEKAAKEMETLPQRVGTKKRYADVIIAAMALAGGHTVVTRNVNDFKDLLPAARIQNWIDQVY
jgi:predicted nucleic acid-binding protein